MRVSVWRGDHTGGQMQGFDVPQQANQTVLDVVTWIQRHRDPTLTYRFACRVGMCGSCAMMVNGEPRWTCRTHVGRVVTDGAVEVAPLRNLPVIKDLATDMTQFFDKWVQAEGRHHPSATREDAMVPVDPASAARQQADAAIECINCAVCYSACDVVNDKPDYLGPAAMNRAWTLINDERDAGRTTRLAAVAGDAGCHNCHSHQSCMQYCPNHLSPTASIAGLKRESAKAALKGEI